MSQYGSIYIIRNTVNKKVYIGQTSMKLNIRFSDHLCAARHNKDYVLGKAIRKYGEDKFSIELIEECPIENLNEREKYWISYYKSTNNKYGYNMSIGGNVTRIKKSLIKEEVIRMFKEGLPAFKIAKVLHTSVYSITDILKESNIEYGLALQKTSNEEELLIIDLYRKGYSTIEIGNKFNKNKSTIRRILLRNNVELRTFKETKNLGRNLPTLI